MNDTRNVVGGPRSTRKKRQKSSDVPAKTPAPKTPIVAPPTPIAVPPRPVALDDRVVTQIWLGGVFFTVVVTGMAGYLFGLPSAVLVLVGGAFAAVIALFWSSLRTALGETPLASADAFALGAPRVEEEQKRAVLRALKDLEFERSVGKISEDDYRTLVAQYRAQAKQLLRRIDEQSLENRRRAEEIVVGRGIGPTDAGPADEPGETAEKPAYTAEEPKGEAAEEPKGDDAEEPKGE